MFEKNRQSISETEGKRNRQTDRQINCWKIARERERVRVYKRNSLSERKRKSM